MTFDIKEHIDHYFVQHLPNKFIVDDDTLLSFVQEQQIMLQDPDTYDVGGRCGVAVAYFLQRGIISTILGHVSILTPYYHEHLYLPYSINDLHLVPTGSKNDLDQFFADIHSNKISGILTTIPLRPSYDEIMAAWRQKIESEPVRYYRRK